MKKKMNSVLLIDDDPATNYLNRLVIERAEITERIEIALNGKEALQYLNKCGKPENPTLAPPELIFLDINMPVMDGWSFLEAYQKLNTEVKEKSVIVMLSTSLNPDDKKKAEKTKGISAFKSKPLKLDTLKEVMEKHFAEYI